MNYTVEQLDTDTLLAYYQKIGDELRSRDKMSAKFEARFNRNKRVLVLMITSDCAPGVIATVQQSDNGMYLLEVGNKAGTPDNAGLYLTMDEAVESCLNITGW